MSDSRGLVTPDEITELVKAANYTGVVPEDDLIGMIQEFDRAKITWTLWKLARRGEMRIHWKDGETMFTLADEQLGCRPDGIVEGL